MATVGIAGSSSFHGYTGETENQIRHGKGVYVYENKFFKYEGQWHNGHKHGHGKLLLGDGGYYEGPFMNGEIEGRGYRVFGLTGSTYTGEFHNGEFHGYGLLVEENGGQYEGGWSHNKREGQGILRFPDGTIFEGEFHNHKRHGVGTLISGNGDSYEGDWINGLQHGHGIQRCADGTVYTGQWRAGVYHGEGELVHCSGFSYQGMWLQGSPAEETARLVSCDERSPLVIEQGHTFTLSFNCVNKHGHLINDNGRSFIVSCYIDKGVVRRNSTKPSFSALLKEDTSIIPHGEVHHYDMLQTSRPIDKAVSEESLPRPTSTTSIKGEEGEGEETKGLLHCPSMFPNKPGGLCVNASLQGPETRSMHSLGKGVEPVTSEERFLSTLVSPCPAHSREGRVEFMGLYIPPPPAPQLETVINKTTPTKNPLLSRSSTMTLSGRGPSPIPSRSSTPSNYNKSDIANSKSSGKSKKSPVPGSKGVKPDKERLLHIKREKYCATGAYVIEVAEATTPPFLDKLLPPTYLELRVVLPKITSKETSLDKILNKNRIKPHKQK